MPMQPAESSKTIHCILWCAIIKYAFRENRDQPPLAYNVIHCTCMYMSYMYISASGLKKIPFKLHNITELYRLLVD